MKNRYCSFFLFMLFVDGGIALHRNILSLSGMEWPQMPMVMLAEGAFAAVFLLLSLVQVIIAFNNKMKWAAKIIGLYPLTFTLIAVVARITSLLTGRPHIDSTNASRFAVGQAIYLSVVSLGQLLLGIWAAKKLASGHYEV